MNPSLAAAFSSKSICFVALLITIEGIHIFRITATFSLGMWEIFGITDFKEGERERRNLILLVYEVMSIPCSQETGA